MSLGRYANKMQVINFKINGYQCIDKNFDYISMYHHKNYDFEMNGPTIPS